MRPWRPNLHRRSGSAARWSSVRLLTGWLRVRVPPGPLDSEGLLVRPSLCACRTMVSPPVSPTGYGGFDSPQARDDRRRRRSFGPVDVGYRNYNGPKVATLGRPSQRSAGRTSSKVAGACQRPTSLTSSVRTPSTSRPRHRSRWRLACNHPYKGRQEAAYTCHCPEDGTRRYERRWRGFESFQWYDDRRAHPATERDVHALLRLAPGWASKTHGRGSIPWWCAIAILRVGRGLLVTQGRGLDSLVVCDSVTHAATSGEGARLISAPTRARLPPLRLTVSLRV